MEKQKKRLPDSFVVIFGLLILLAMGIVALASNDGEFSAWERRFLTDHPTVSLTNWKLDKDMESFLTDHVPGRHTLVAIDSFGQFLTGRNTQLSAWYVADAMLEPPEPAETGEIEKKLRRFGKIADEAGVPWLLISPRTHGYLLRDRMFPTMARLYDREEEDYAFLESYPNMVTMPEAFNDDPESMYYKTDHHWTLQGAYQAYLALAERLGYEPLPLESFRLTEYTGFKGTTLSRSGFPRLLADTLKCAEPDSEVVLTTINRNVEQQYDRLIFPENADGWDGYAVYLNGNHGTLIIERPDAPEGTLIVYKDSMANCLLPMLSQHFRRIIAVDARYDSGVFSDALARSDDTKEILFAYSLDSLVNDTEIIKKAK